MEKTNGAGRTKSGERTVLVLHGGGALGSYQAGAYEQLAADGYAPSWISGISIGAINAALIVGNPPERRVERLRSFWEKVSSHLVAVPAFGGQEARSWFNEASAAFAFFFGIPGFFAPRMPPVFVFPPGSVEALSHYDTRPLRRTLEELVDFDRINTGKIRLSVGAVNIGTGNFVCFDSDKQEIGPEHIMASGALPPWFPPVEIDGQHYWDGALVSNTCLQYVIDEVPRKDMLIFQVDLFNARGRMPHTLSEASERERDIRFSSRTRFNTDVAHQMQSMRAAAHRLASKLPANLKEDPDAKLLEGASCGAAVTIVHLIHRRKNYYTPSKGYEFSRRSVLEHWDCGRNDVQRTLGHGAWRSRAKPTHGASVFDLTRDARD